MKKLILISALILSVSAAFAQFDFSDKPFQIPKGAIVLNKAPSKNVKAKVGQTLIYQVSETYAMGTDDAADDMLQQETTHIYNEKKANIMEKGEHVATFIWKIKSKGKCVIFIRLGEKEDREDRFTIEVK